jgi:predicted NBD/HSP70 family sugar kinase
MILGLDIGGTNTDFVIFENGEFKQIGTFRTEEVLDRFNDIVGETVAQVRAIGVGIAAWIKDGEFIHAPNLPIIPELDFPRPYIFENDANCFAFFASKETGISNLLGVTIGTGIGGGIITHGEIYRGCGIAGEIGHTYVGGDRHCKCGKTGCLEAYFGGWSLKEFEKEPEILLASGEIYDCDGFEKFCIVLANAVMVLNPEAVAIGGRIGSRLQVEIVEKRVAKYLPTVFKPNFFVIEDDYAVAKGAALLAANEFSLD